MTAIVGMLCTDGVVIGADSSSTFAPGPQTSGFRPTIEQPTKKVHVFSDTVVVAGTGSVGLGQRFCHVVENAYGKQLFQKPFIEVGTTLSTEALQNFASTGVGYAPDGRMVGYGALVGYARQGRAYLCEFALGDFQPEWKTEGMWYVSMGSGQPITDPFLGFLRRVFAKKGQPSVAEATFYVAWTLQNVIDLNPGGIKGPLQIGVIKSVGNGKYKAEILPDYQEHIKNVENVEEYLCNYESLKVDQRAVDIPDPSPKQ